jgi:hypothetical protein
MWATLGTIDLGTSGGRRLKIVVGNPWAEEG